MSALVLGNGSAYICDCASGRFFVYVCNGGWLYLCVWSGMCIFGVVRYVYVFCHYV